MKKKKKTRIQAYVVSPMLFLNAVRTVGINCDFDQNYLEHCSIQDISRRMNIMEDKLIKDMSDLGIHDPEIYFKINVMEEK
jgi:hypothetical protein